MPLTFLIFFSFKGRLTKWFTHISIVTSSLLVLSLLFSNAGTNLMLPVNIEITGSWLRNHHLPQGIEKLSQLLGPFFVSAGRLINGNLSSTNSKGMIKMHNPDANKIVQLVGGKANVVSLMHCTTRLRFVLRNHHQADIQTIRQLPGVLGVTYSNGQFQIVVGNKVNDVFAAVNKVLQTTTADTDQTTNPRPKSKWYHLFLDFIVSVFQPLIPAIAAGGILRSILMLLSLLGWMSSKSSLYQILNFAGTAPVYFLPLLVAITAARKLGVNDLVAASVVGVLVLPNMVKALGAGMSLWGMRLQNIDYSSQVFSAILTVLLYAVLEKTLMKYSPRAIQVFFVPLVAMTITVPLSLIFLGPAGFVAGQAFANAILWLFNHVGWVATAILAGALPLLVASGMHKPLVPYVITTLGTMKKEMLYLPASLAHNISEAGTCFAIAIKTKDKRLKAAALSGGISGLCGITEPAVYGVTLQNKRALCSVMTSSFIGGAFIGLVGLNGFAPVGPGLTTLTIFVDKNHPANLLHALWGGVFSFMLSFTLTLILWKDTNPGEVKAKQTKHQPKIKLDQLKLTSPVTGKMESLSKLNDPVFSSGMMGDGFFVRPAPTSNVVNVPISGTVAMVAPTSHAFGIRTASGAEVLVHVGLETVKLEGKFFRPLLKVGQQVHVGQPALKVDFEKVAQEGYETPVIVVVTEPGTQPLSLPLATN
ncbi:beta-glucoside-specific PTS transporter subunit IIABC [Limosilactobacillus difficilis]|uniref:beta-glucoside-specific PTS transporter subunit IIABC n=1 Tax=Limosilactobacillus difficilis TaxID=2991838 RepID=UPI0024BB2A29|nr:beta-glucoside-specific PTS transporter subunit IIABC [Limosilactobacillus difficilis]